MVEQLHTRIERTAKEDSMTSSQKDFVKLVIESISSANPSWRLYSLNDEIALNFLNQLLNKPVNAMRYMELSTYLRRKIAVQYRFSPNDLPVEGLLALAEYDPDFLFFEPIYGINDPKKFIEALETVTESSLELPIDLLSALFEYQKQCFEDDCLLMSAIFVLKDTYKDSRLAEILKAIVIERNAVPTARLFKMVENWDEIKKYPIAWSSEL